MSKLNTTQHYGHVFGNHAASFEQNGRFFDGGGKEILENGTTVVNEEDEGDAYEVAKDFLQNLLDNTQMLKSKIVKEAETQEISWHLVENAATELEVTKFKKGNAIMWKLSEE